MPITRHKVDLCFRVLLYQDKDGEYVAHALEMDLIGQGNSPNKAIADLRSTIEAQISYAAYQGDLNLVAFPAPKDVFGRWEAAARAAIADLAKGDVSIKGHVQATFLAIPAADLKRILAKRASFRAATVQELACAET